MAKYINPFTDWGFKRLFGQEFSKELLISFLNDLLEGELRVKNVTFMDKEQLPITKDQRIGGQGCQGASLRQASLHLLGSAIFQEDGRGM